MNHEQAAILESLHAVERLRGLAQADPALADRLHAVKAWQQLRFRHTYADLLASPRYAPAARFFLHELYGPGDYSRRDAQLVRVVPALVRLFSAEIVATVSAMAALHALTEELDVEMARHLGSLPVDATRYAAAWAATGRAADRERQIALVLQVGRALDKVTRSMVLRTSLRLMRTPAAAAGLGDLQALLESGFDIFRNMRGADDFLATLGARERALARALFDAPPDAPPRHLLPAD